MPKHRHRTSPNFKWAAGVLPACGQPPRAIPAHESGPDSGRVTGEKLQRGRRKRSITIVFDQSRSIRSKLRGAVAFLKTVNPDEEISLITCSAIRES